MHSWTLILAFAILTPGHIRAEESFDPRMAPDRKVVLTAVKRVTSKWARADGKVRKELLA